VKVWRARRAVLLLLLLTGLLGVTSVARGQYASRTGNFIGAVGGACDSSTNTYGWPDTNGDILKCVSNVWTLVTQPATAAGSTGYLQFNSSGVLGASSNLFWDNANFRLGIGSSAPVVSLDLSQRTDALALPVGTQGQEPASPMNGMIRYSTTANDVEAYIAGAWTTLTTGGSTAAITLGTSAATPNPASSYSATTGLFSPASGVAGVAAAGTEMMRVNATGVGIGTTAPANKLDVTGGAAFGTYAGVAAPSNGLIVSGNVGIGSSAPTKLLDVNGNINLASNLYSGVYNILGMSSNVLQLGVGNVARVDVLTNFRANGGYIQATAAGSSFRGNQSDTAAGGGAVSFFGVTNTDREIRFGIASTTGLANWIQSYKSGGNISPFTLQPDGGNVGIGTTGPDALISLGGQSAQTIDMVRETTASTAGNNLTLQAGGATPLGTDKAGGTLALSSGISTGTGSSGINFNIYKAAGSSGSTDNATTTAMTITGAGNVGIGTTAPLTKLHVIDSSAANTIPLTIENDTAGNTSAGPALQFVNSNVGNPLAKISTTVGVGYTNNTLGFDVQGSRVMTLLGANGNVGVGDANPSAKFEIAAGGNGVPANQIALGYVGGGFESYITSGHSATAASNSVGFSVFNGSSAANVMTLLGSGNVGIGTNAPAYLLHVGSPAAVGVVADFQNSSGYCTFSPSANGILTTCTSDVRLKKDIVDAGDALAWLGTMHIRDFTLRATGERRTGVIAQEMMKVHPEMVRMGATGFYQVDVPDAWKLIKAIQELKAENNDLMARIGAEDDALKAANDNIAELRASFEAYKDAHP
jgi:hypothetical protein